MSDEVRFHSIKSAFEEEPEITEDLADATVAEILANQLLDETIEVLEGLQHWMNDYPHPDSLANETERWWGAQAKPLLDNLKALKKEGTE